MSKENKKKYRQIHLHEMIRGIKLWAANDNLCCGLAEGRAQTVEDWVEQAIAWARGGEHAETLELMKRYKKKLERDFSEELRQEALNAIAEAYDLEFYEVKQRPKYLLELQSGDWRDSIIVVFPYGANPMDIKRGEDIELVRNIMRENNYTNEMTREVIRCENWWWRNLSGGDTEVTDEGWNDIKEKSIKEEN